MTALAIDAHGLRKSFGRRLVADGLDVQLPEGPICGIPVRGSVLLLLLVLGLFIASNLALGCTISTVARPLAQFALLSSFMLWGFLYPSQGMPIWARHR